MSCCDDKPQKGQEKAGLKGLVTGPRRWMLLGAVGSFCEVACMCIVYDLAVDGVSPALY